MDLVFILPSFLSQLIYGLIDGFSGVRARGNHDDPTSINHKKTFSLQPSCMNVLLLGQHMEFLPPYTS
ncbi:hypothetical protein Peur_030358 [Populus x canadensis]